MRPSIGVFNKVFLIDSTACLKHDPVLINFTAWATSSGENCPVRQHHPPSGRLEPGCSSISIPMILRPYFYKVDSKYSLLLETPADAVIVFIRICQTSHSVIVRTSGGSGIFPKILSPGFFLVSSKPTSYWAEFLQSQLILWQRQIIAVEIEESSFGG